MFKRRASSKDLSTKTGYDNIQAKPPRKLVPSHSSKSASLGSSLQAASVANISAPHKLQHQGSGSSSSYSSRKTSASPSPQATGGTDGSMGLPSAPAGAPPLTSVKAIPLSGFVPAAPVAPVETSASNKNSSSINSMAKEGVPPRSSSSSLKSGNSHHHQQQLEPRSLIIGEGVLFEGTTEGCAAAVIGGKLLGTVKSRRLEITRAGKMEGMALAETAEIAGLFEGTLTVTKSLKICSTGRFKGDVSFGSIVVENGGKIEGKVNFGGCRSPAPESAPAAAGLSSPSSSSSSSSSAGKTSGPAKKKAADPPAPGAKVPSHSAAIKTASNLMSRPE